MMRKLGQLVRDQSGAAAAEMVLVIPLLLVLMFGVVDLGNYFLSEHVVDKAVRDASRYAARLPLVDYTSCSVPSGGIAEQQTQRVARFGDPSGSGGQRLAGWTADNMTTVTIDCDDGTSGNSWATGGIYTDFPDGAPVVTVSATVPYNSLFGLIGLGSATLSLNAQSEAAVIGA
jgi:Flp pilus assembly protein TadG